MNKTIITVAPTGSWTTKKNNPNIPFTPEEIAEDVYQSWKAGAAIAHLHMRDDNGNPTMDLALFRETVKLIRGRCDIIINLTSTGDENATDEQRQIHLKELLPEIATFNCGSMNWMHRGLLVNHPDFLRKLGMTMQEVKVKPELEIFDLGMIYNSLYYLNEGILKEPAH